MKAVDSPSRPSPASVLATEPPGISRAPLLAWVSTSARSRSISCMMPFCTPSRSSCASAAVEITSMTALPMPIT